MDCIIYFSQETHALGTTLICIIQMRKVRHREVK